MGYAKTNWIEEVTPTSPANMNKIEQALEDVYKTAYAEDLTEVTSTGTGAFADPTTGTAGPEVTVVVPTGGRFVALQAECQAKHSSNNTDGVHFVLRFSQDGGAYAVNPLVGYDSSVPYQDTGALGQTFGASAWFADTTYRPLRLGQGRTPTSDGSTSVLAPALKEVWLPAGSWRIRMGYGVKGGGSGTAYFKTRRLRAQVLPN